MHATTHMHDATIRRAQAADVGALTRLLQEPVVAMDGNDDPDAVRDARDDAALPAQDALRGDTDTVVADAREGLQGYLQLRWGGAPPSREWMRDAVELKRHYVRARHRGAGVAARLLERALGIAREREAACIWLKVRKETPQAVRFYQKHGFRIAGTAICTEGARPRESWVMHRAVAGARG